MEAALVEEGGTVGRPAPEAELDEASWVRGARQGDRTSFERLYRRHVGRVHGLCLRLTRNAAEAEEMTQEVFVRAWSHMDRIRDAAHFAAWLRTVATNLAINERRSLARWGAPQELPDEPPARDLPLPGASADLEDAIRELPPSARTIFVLHDVYGFKHREIARMTGLQTGTTKAQLHRARRRLREALA
jgi:RNA polymerase sigma-70 factor (ECF subfamily)